MFDAMNQPVKIGQTYGYTTSKGSVVTVVTGRARKLTEKKVTLDVLTRVRFLYGVEAKNWPSELEQKHVSVHPCHLFPVITDAQKQAARIALGADIQRDVMSKLQQDFSVSLGFELLEAIREAALDACTRHGLVPAEE